MIRREQTLRQSSGIKNPGSNIGKMTFNNITIPIYDAYSRGNKRKYLIFKKYENSVNVLVKGDAIGDIIEECSDQTGLYKNCVVSVVYPDTNFIDLMELHFDIDIPINEVRERKLNKLLK
jgi:hypothetical protein